MFSGQEPITHFCEMRRTDTQVHIDMTLGQTYSQTLKANPTLKAECQAGLSLCNDSVGDRTPELIISGLTLITGQQRLGVG